MNRFRATGLVILGKKRNVSAHVSESETPVFQRVNAHSTQDKFTSFPSTFAQLEWLLAFLTHSHRGLPSAGDRPEERAPSGPLRRAPWRHRACPAAPANLALAARGFCGGGPGKINNPAPGLAVWPTRSPQLRLQLLGARGSAHGRRGFPAQPAERDGAEREFPCKSQGEDTLEIPHSLTRREETARTSDGTGRSGSFRAEARGEETGEARERNHSGPHPGHASTGALPRPARSGAATAPVPHLP